jgi:hypothetical protein
MYMLGSLAEVGWNKYIRRICGGPKGPGRDLKFVEMDYIKLKRETKESDSR